MVRRSLITLVILLGLAGSADAANKCVNPAASGDDTTSYAANNGTTVCWDTLGRAVWGNASRSAPDATEAAKAGDTVLVTGGTYHSDATTGVNSTPLYNPAGTGTAGNYITFTCVGTCTIEAPVARGPAIGADGKDYIKWYADVTLGYSWTMVSDAAGGNTADTSANSTWVNVKPDTGPVVLNNTTGSWLEGLILDGGAQQEQEDNYPGIELENCTSCVVRNNVIFGFQCASGNHNGAGIMLYSAADPIIEHNLFYGSGVSIYIKGETTFAQTGVIFRYNLITSCLAANSGCIFVYISNAARIYQNIISGGPACIEFGGLDAVNASDADWAFNNTCISPSVAGILYNGSTTPPWFSGGRAWNTIVYNAPTVILWADSTFQVDTYLDYEHNLYNTFTTFANDSTATSYAAFSSWTGAFASQDQASPVSITSAPGFANAAGSDYRLCTGAGTPHASCAGASAGLNLGVDLGDLDGDASTTDNINAGAHVTNLETIGVETAQAGGSTTYHLRRPGAQ